MTKYIFLDVDGVLNNKFTNAVAPSGCTGIIDKNVKMISEIVKATGAEVILSSDWRLMENDDPDFKYLRNKLWYKGGIKLSGITPDIGWEDRGEEIALYLKFYPADAWVVIDDIEFPDFEILKGHVVLTDPYEGITEDDVTRAIEVLTNGS